MLHQTANRLMLLLVLLHGLIGSWSCCACCLVNVATAAVPAPSPEPAHAAHGHAHVAADEGHEHHGAPCGEHDHEDCQGYRSLYRVHPPVESPELGDSEEHIALDVQALTAQTVAAIAIAAFSDASSSEGACTSAMGHCALTQVWRI